jgi:hypothetical protein
MGAGHEERDANGHFGMSGRDQVTLSAQERQLLAHLEQRLRLDDPDFAFRMRGRSFLWFVHALGRLRVPRLPAWCGPVLVLVGLTATLWAVDILAWLSVLTVGVTAVGAHRVGQSLRTRFGRAGGSEE